MMLVNLSIAFSEIEPSIMIYYSFTMTIILLKKLTDKALMT